MANLTPEQRAELAANPDHLTPDMQRQIAVGDPPADPMNTLTAGEVAELRDLARLHHASAAAKDYITADVLRTTLMAWGAWPPEKGFHPWFEDPQHRKTRREHREMRST